MTPIVWPRSGTVYAAALNRPATIARLGDALTKAPYLAPPRAPVLHIKPANTWIGPGEVIPCPADQPALRMGGGLGLLIGKTASRVRESVALDCVAGYLLANDVSIPYQSHYRPAIKERCRDGFLAIGVATTPDLLDPPDSIAITIEVNGTIRARTTGADLIRGAARLLADVSQFIRLDPGDLLLVGEPDEPPLARVGDTVRIIAEGLRALGNVVGAEGSGS